MKLIIGLGNIGEEYEKSRHNSGFMFVERMNKRLGGGDFSLDKKMEMYWVRTGEIIFAKPTTYMNESGRAVRRMLDYYKLNIEDLVVVHDDLDIRLGDYKVKLGVGPKVHNGLKSVEKSLGSEMFTRVRLGVDSRNESQKKIPGSNYVLSKMQKEELKVLEGEMDLAMGDLAVALGLEFE